MMWFIRPKRWWKHWNAKLLEDKVMEVSIKDIIKPENLVYQKSSLLTEKPMHYCPGCTHGVVNRLIAEVIEELGLQQETIGVTPVGCSVMVFINNGIYGMTGGQMAPTTLEGMAASTCPFGRDPERDGNPLNMTEIVATLPGTRYVTRQAAHTAGAVRKLKKALIKGFNNQKENKGTSFIEVVSTCNSGWKMTPVQANEWMVENMFPFYPLGDIKDK